MSDRILVPLANGRWLALSGEIFAEALAAGSAVMGAPRSATEGQDSEPLLDAETLGAALSLPPSWLEQAGREGRIPSVQAGRWRRFKRSAVERALSNGKGAA